MVSRLGITAWKLVLISTLHSLCCYAQELDIRLFGGSGNYEGRVEVRVNSRWGTVCNETWDMDDATVVCRELGNRTAIKYDVMYGEGEGEGPILYTKTMCTGEEERLQDCPKEEPTVDVCNHTQDAGVQCSIKDADLRLVGGSTPSEGRVEVFNMRVGEWGRVCAGTGWDRGEADVVCRTVGYPNGAEASSGSFGIGIGRVFIIDLDCTGRENTFLGCKKANFGNLQACPSDEVDATVVCIPTAEVLTEELSKGAIAGIGVGFGLVIIMCCIFSLNCKCRPCWKKREVDETDVYAAASKVLSTTSNLKSETDTRQDSISDIDPNMFIFAPKNPPAGFGTSSDASGTNGVLPNIDETKEPNGVPTGTGNKGDSSSQDEQKPSTEGDHVAVSMTTEENKDDIHVYDDIRDYDDIHVYDDVKLTLGEGIDMHDEKESKIVTIDEQGRAHFNKESHDLDDHVYREIKDNDNDNAELVDNDNTKLGENDYLEPVANRNPEIVDNDNPVLRESDYLEVIDNDNAELVKNAELVDNDNTKLGENDYLELVANDNPELRHNDDSIQNEDVAEDENESVLMDQQAHSKMGMTDEDIGVFDTRL